MALFDSLFGYRTIYGPDGKPLPERGRLKVAGASVADDELTKTTVITFPPSLLNTATNLATPGALVLRDKLGGAAFGGTVAVENLTVGGSLTLLAGAEFSALEFTLGQNVTETRVQSGAPRAQPSGWAEYLEGVWMNSALGAVLLVPLEIPNGAFLEHVDVTFAPAAGHAGLPASMPSVRIRKFPPSGSNPNIGVAATDPSSTVVAYEATHVITASAVIFGNGYQVDNSAERYHVLITAESGGNGIAGATVPLVTATWIRPAGSELGQD